MIRNINNILRCIMYNNVLILMILMKKTLGQSKPFIIQRKGTWCIFKLTFRFQVTNHRCIKEQGT